MFKRKFVDTVQGDIYDTIEDDNKRRNNELDIKLYEEYCSKLQNANYKGMEAVRSKLPAFELQEEIVKAINENQVIVITGETGCGKTTQVAQFILDDYLKQKKGSLCHICCTQPRRISAYSVAVRVANERAEQLGESVGYQIRLER